MPSPDDEPDDLGAEPADPDLDEGDDDDDDAEPFLARLVPESVLLATGRAAPTGLHLALWGPDCAGLDAWTVGLMWGWTDPELARLRAEGEHLVLVLQTPGPRWGLATAEVLTSLLIALRPDEAVASSGDFIRAVGLPPAIAEGEGLREAQHALSRVFGLRDPLYGTGRVPGPDDDPPAIPLYVDTQLQDGAVNALLPGSSALVEDYAELPVLVRLKWPEEDEP